MLKQHDLRMQDDIYKLIKAISLFYDKEKLIN